MSNPKTPEAMYEELVAAIVKVVPEIKAWEIGCRVRGMHGEVLSLVGQRELKKPPLTPLEIKYPRALSRHTHVDVFEREDGSRYEYTFSDDTKIIGRPITLEDVLRAMPNRKGHYWSVDFSGALFNGDSWQGKWLLCKPLSEQSPETISFLHSLLKP